MGGEEWRRGATMEGRQGPPGVAGFRGMAGALNLVHPIFLGDEWYYIIIPDS